MFRLIYKENKWIWVGIKKVIQASYKGLDRVSALGKVKQLLGNAARAAILCSRGEEGRPLAPSTQHFFP